MAESMATGTHIEWLGKQLLSLIRSDNPEGHLRLNPTDIELTDAVILGPWLSAVVSATSINNADEFKRLLVLADGGLERDSDHPVNSTLRTAILKGFSLGLKVDSSGQPDASTQIAIAEILRRRLGEIFGADQGTKWLEFPNEHNMVRTWLMHQVLDILFTHLQPDPQFAGQTVPRRKLWGQGQLAGSVQKVFFMVGPEFDQIMQLDDIRELMSRHPDSILRIRLEGSFRQAVICMHLRAPNGRIWTVIEGNANCKIYLLEGEHEPPFSDEHSYVDYTQDIVNGTIAEQAQYTTTHRGKAWIENTKTALRLRGFPVT